MARPWPDVGVKRPWLVVGVVLPSPAPTDSFTPSFVFCSEAVSELSCILKIFRM